MIKITDYAILSAHIYNIATEGYGALKIGAMDKNKIPIDSGWYRVTDVDLTMHSHNHLFAQLYIKFDNGVATDAVVAVRGTVFSDPTNDTVDVLSWYSDLLGDGASDKAPLIFTSQLANFVFKAQDYVRRYLPGISTLKFTGHSLGGALAQLMPLKAGFPGRAVVFNSPGVGHIAGVMPDKQSWIYNINSRYGLINKIGLTLGHIYFVDVPQMESEAKTLFEQADVNDLQKSQQLYQQANKLAQNKLILLGAAPVIVATDEAALYYRSASYIKTAVSAANQPQIARVVNASCQTNDTQAWYDLKAKLAIKLCSVKSTDREYVKIMAAQHSIDNMVQALQIAGNAKLAYCYI